MAKPIAGRSARAAARHCQQVLAGIGLDRSGSRYSLTNKDVAPLRAKFTKWAAERDAAKKAKEDKAKSA